MKCCEKYAAALSAFADGELDGAGRAEPLAHIEHCEACRDYLSELMIMHTVLADMPELQAPQGFAEKVLERVHEDERVRRRHRRAIPRVLAACAALVVISAAALRFTGSGATAGYDAEASADTAAPESSQMAGAQRENENSYTYTYSAVQKDGSQYSGQYEPAMDAPAAGDADGSPERSDYLTVYVDAQTAADFLAGRGMAVYSETEESVSFLVTPEVAHELGAEIAADEDAAAALMGADEILIVEIAKVQPDAQAGADAPEGSAELPTEEEEVSR